MGNCCLNSSSCQHEFGSFWQFPGGIQLFQKLVKKTSLSFRPFFDVSKLGSTRAAILRIDIYYGPASSSLKKIHQQQLSECATQDIKKNLERLKQTPVVFA